MQISSRSSFCDFFRNSSGISPVTSTQTRSKTLGSLWEFLRELIEGFLKESLSGIPIFFGNSFRNFLRSSLKKKCLHDLSGSFSWIPLLFLCQDFIGKFFRDFSENFFRESLRNRFRGFLQELIPGFL